MSNYLMDTLCIIFISPYFQYYDIFHSLHIDIFLFLVPDPPENVHVVATTTTQCRVSWEPPAQTNGILKGYYVYNGEWRE